MVSILSMCHWYGHFSLASAILLLSAMMGGICRKLVIPVEPSSGYTSLMRSIRVLGGMIIAFFGVIGVYLSKNYSESKHRTYTIARELLRKDTD